jgi:hypothetical protein
MSSTPGLDVLLADPNQVGKIFALDTAIAALEKALCGLLAVAVDDGSHVSPWKVPFDTGDEPGAVKTALRFIVLTVGGVAGADWTALFPSGKTKLFIIQNNTTGGHNVIAKVSGGTGVTVTTGQTRLCFLNGTDVVDMPFVAPSSQPHEVGNFIDGKPTVGEVIMRYVFGRTVTYPANFGNNQLKAGIAANASAQFKVNKNGVQVGTATVALGATTAIWASSGGTAVTYNAGDELDFIAPSPQDLNLADLTWLFVGTR